jgi:pimeloyl-ACP methyl ester carboxylesterase
VNAAGEPAAVADWAARGRVLSLPGGDVWVLDQPATEEARLEPVVVLHGFPTCSFDWRPVLPGLSRRRRVVLFDFPGFGLSAKPDQRYSLRRQADVAEAVCATLRLERIALVTHDMGDSIGGELLARDLDGALDLEITRRVLANGSIYLDLAHLTPGQLFLLELPDARLEPRPAGPPPDDGEAMRAALAATFSPDSPPDPGELEAQWALIARGGGQLLLPRTIRYIEDWRAE